MPSTYDVGDVVRITGVYTDTGALLQDPDTVHFHYDTPTSTAPSTQQRTGATTGTVNGITRASSGTFFFDITTTGRGLYEGRFKSTGTVTAAGETWFSVRPLRVTT